MTLVWPAQSVRNSRLTTSKRRRSHNELEQPCRQNIIGVGQFTIVHKSNNKVVRKVPSDKSYIYSMSAFQIEGRIYGHLIHHDRIARCLNWTDGFVDLQYECNGNLGTYLKQYPSDEQG